MTEWISIKDRLPENSDEVLVCRYNSELNFHSVGVDSYNGYGKWLDFSAHYSERVWTLTHWMPLPEVPKRSLVIKCDKCIHKPICKARLEGTIDILERLNQCCCYVEVDDPEAFVTNGNVDDIARQPIKKVAEVRCGKWVDVPYTYFGAKRYLCNQCCDDEFWDKRYIEIKESFCPNCGADMRDIERN